MSLSPFLYCSHNALHMFPGTNIIFFIKKSKKTEKIPV